MSATSANVSTIIASTDAIRNCMAPNSNTMRVALLDIKSQGRLYITPQTQDELKELYPEVWSDLCNPTKPHIVGVTESIQKLAANFAEQMLQSVDDLTIVEYRASMMASAIDGSHKVMTDDTSHPYGLFPACQGRNIAVFPSPDVVNEV